MKSKLKTLRGLCIFIILFYSNVQIQFGNDKNLGLYLMPQQIKNISKFDSILFDIFKRELAAQNYSTNIPTVELKYVIFYDNENSKYLYFLYKDSDSWKSFSYPNEYKRNEYEIWKFNKYTSPPLYRNFYAEKLVFKEESNNDSFRFRFTLNIAKTPDEALNQIWYYVSNEAHTSLPFVSDKYVQTENSKKIITKIFGIFKECIYFDLNDSTVDSNSIDFEIVTRMIMSAYESSKLNNNKFYIYFVGHADNTGSNLYNKIISQSRARNARNAIIEFCNNNKNLKEWFQKQQVHGWAFGNKIRAGRKTDRDDGDPYNRRCEVIISSDAKIVEHEYLIERKGKDSFPNSSYVVF